MNIESLIRPNILALKPYSSARHDFTGRGEVFLDANENPFENSVNRYPDPLQQRLKKIISSVKTIGVENIFLGNGSDEAIDLILRIFCIPGADEIMILPPTYGMYQVSADIADIFVKKIKLDDQFQPNIDEILKQASDRSKVLFLCSPNNPTGNLIHRTKIIELIKSFKGMVVIDEAYIDFCPGATFLPLTREYENLIVMQTLSKAWGMAAIRLGMAFASDKVISYFNKVKAPYNVNILTQQFALDRLIKVDEMNLQVQTILLEKQKLIDRLSSLKEVLKVYPSDSNFILVKFQHADEVYQSLVAQGIVVRNRSKEPGCEGCLRITIGTPSENEVLINRLTDLTQSTRI